MKYPFRAFGAAALIAAGVVGDRVLSPAPNSSPLTAANAASQSNTLPAANNAATTATSFDAITKHAFAVASPSVVYIENVGVGSGSGVIYDTGGDIVTNAHVVNGAQTLHVTLNSGKTYTARIVGTDTADDLAVIHINARGLPAARFASAGTFSVAQCRSRAVPTCPTPSRLLLPSTRATPAGRWLPWMEVWSASLPSRRLTRRTTPVVPHRASDSPCPARV
jgi:S1-C subfamily serine protease